MNLKIYCIIFAYCFVSATTTCSNKMQSKANQIHTQIQTLLDGFAPILPQQSSSQAFDINSIPLQENKHLTLEEMQKFILRLQLASQHLEQLNQQYQHQEKIIAEHKKLIEQLIKIAQWFHQPKTMESWCQYTTMHQQTCTIIQQNLTALKSCKQLDDICSHIGQSIINTISILIIQLHIAKKHPEQLQFFASAYQDFMALFQEYKIQTHAEINDMVQGCINQENVRLF